MFLTIWRDDVHNVDALQYAAPYVGPNAFSVIVPEHWLAALQGFDDSERIIHHIFFIHDADGSVEYDISEDRLHGWHRTNLWLVPPFLAHG